MLLLLQFPGRPRTSLLRFHSSPLRQTHVSKLGVCNISFPHYLGQQVVATWMEEGHQNDQNGFNAFKWVYPISVQQSYQGHQHP